MAWLPCGEKDLRIHSAVSTEYRRVTDRRTDGRTDGQTDGQTGRHTSCNCIVRATRHAVKTYTPFILVVYREPLKSET